MSDVLTSKLGGLFIQFHPGAEPKWLGCSALDTIAEPSGDQTLIQCLNADGEYDTVGVTSAPPGAVTFSVRAKTFPESDVLDDLKNCDVAVYALSRNCGRRDDFTGWQRAHILRARVTTRTDEGLASDGEEKETTRTFDFSARSPVYRARTVTVGRQTIAATYALNDIAFCNLASCGGDCGAAADKGEVGFTIGDLVAASPATNPKAWVTDDAGAVWAESVGDTFAFIGNAMAAECFPINSTTTRWLIARGQVTAEGAEVAYSDDNGATWTAVNVGSTDNEGALGAGALFAKDKSHIWFATSAGRVFFSDDAGATWTEQTEALTASGGSGLYAVHFADYDNGYAVGANDTIIYTNDGGETWDTITAPTSGATLTSLFVWSKYQFIFGTNGGYVYDSLDGGETFDSKTFTGQAAGTVASIDFVNRYCGYMVHNPVAGQGYVHRTIDGGYTWERLTTPANSGLNSIDAVDVNLAYAVGEVNSGTAVVLKVTA